MAAYVAKAGLKCVILIPSGTPLEKIVQMLICGAEVISMKKSYPEIYEVGLKSAESAESIGCMLTPQ